jgi:hypothetical protein
VALIEVVIHEGRNRIVRRMLEEAGHPVSRLVRTSVGPIKLGDLRPGRTRRLTGPEVASLFRLVGGGPDQGESGRDGSDDGIGDSGDHGSDHGSDDGGLR